MDIILFAGQSNCVGGRSDPSLLPSSALDALIPFSIYYTFNAGLDNEPDEYSTLHNLTLADGGGNGFETETNVDITVPAGTSSWGYGAEITCCRQLYDVNAPVACLKVARGSTSLEVDWNTELDGGATIQMWPKVKEYMQGFKAALELDGYTPKFKAFVWWQGENDSGSSVQSAAYEYNLRRFFTYVRAVALNPNLPIIICKTVTPLTNTYLTEVQTAQQNVADSMSNVHMYDPSSLPLYEDDTHFYQDAMVTAGEAIATIIESIS